MPNYDTQEERVLEKGMTNEAYSFDAFKCAFTARTELQNRLEEMYSKEKVEELRQNNLGINVLYSIQYDE